MSVLSICRCGSQVFTLRILKPLWGSELLENGFHLFAAPATAGNKFILKVIDKSN